MVMTRSGSCAERNCSSARNTEALGTPVWPQSALPLGSLINGHPQASARSTAWAEIAESGTSPTTTTPRAGTSLSPRSATAKLIGSRIGAGTRVERIGRVERHVVNGVGNHGLSESNVELHRSGPAVPDAEGVGEHAIDDLAPGCGLVSVLRERQQIDRGSHLLPKEPNLINRLVLLRRRAARAVGQP